MNSRPKILLIDNYDSFTYILSDYFLQLGASCTVVRNDEWELADFLTFPFDALVFSPGPQKPEDAGLMMSLLEMFHQKTPILGICLGHQGIGQFFGARLQKAALPMHGKTSTLLHQNHTLFAGLPAQFEVMRYHSLILDQLENSTLEVIAHTPEGEVMAIKHRQLPIVGLQFHPESILTEHGKAILQNWLHSFPLV